MNSAYNSNLEMIRHVESLPGHLLPDEASQERLPKIIQRLEEIAKIS